MDVLTKLPQAGQELFAVIQESLSVRSHTDFFLWMNGDLQSLLPNELILVAWGNFAANDFCFELYPAKPDQCIGVHAQTHFSIFAKSMFNRWMNNGYSPLKLKWPHGYAGSILPELNYLSLMHSALVHGMRNHRDQSSVLYVVFNSAKELPETAGTMFRFLLPYIDASFRNLSRKNVITASNISTETIEISSPEFFLSSREHEIMDWVRQGKTNYEIGIILNISVFTVKNHLQRIFKKLNVLNRAQAVANLSRDRTRHLYG